MTLRLRRDGGRAAAVIFSAMLLAGSGARSACAQTLSPGGAAAAPSPWTGPWVGIAALGGWSTNPTTEFAAESGAEFHRFDTLGSGGGGLASFGYDWRLQGNRLIAGIVGNIGFVHDPGGQVFRTTTNLTGSGQARLGFAASPALLLYAESGVAFANEAVRIDLGGATTQQDRFTPGITIGAGGEYVVATGRRAPLGKAVSLFAEFQHVWWAADTIDMPAAAPGLDFQWQRQSNLVEAGARIHF
jgi:hypothetical protein